MSDVVFASRHLRHEIYEKKQFYPSTSQPRRSRSNRSESDQSTLQHPRTPEPMPTIDFTCEPITGPPSHNSDTTFFNLPESSLSPMAMNDRIRRNSSSSSMLTRTTSFNFDPLVVSRYVEPTGAADVVAATTRSWPPRSFPLDDSDLDQLQENRSTTTRHSTVLTRTALAASAGTARLPPVPSSSSLSVNIPISGSATSGLDPAWTVTAQPVQDGTTDNRMPSNFVLKIAKV